jgi:hypothetical protein
MSRRPLLVGTLLLAPWALFADPPAGWKSYPSRSGAFQIAFPSKPEETKDSIEGVDGGGKIEQTQYTVGLKNGAYLASYQPAPNLAKSEAKVINAALDLTRDRLAKSFQGTVLSSKDVKLEATTGKEFVIDCPKIQGVIRSRAFLTNGRFYLIMLMGTKEFVTTAEADYFLESFKVTAN